MPPTSTHLPQTPSSSRGPDSGTLLLTLSLAFGAALFLSYRFGRIPALHPHVPAWIVQPASNHPLLAGVIASGSLAVIVAASSRWRPLSAPLTVAALLLWLLSRGPLPSPLHLPGALVALLGHRPIPKAAWPFLAEAMALSVCLAAIAAARLRRSRRGGEIAHGSARLATTSDLASADLLSGEGIVLGTRSTWQGEQALTDRSADHALIVMPPGGGKTTGPIAGALLNVDSSALVLDPKGELFQITAGWREEIGHQVIRFAPQAGEGTQPWNPLLEIAHGPGEVAAVSALTDNLITYPASFQGDTHWIASARSMLRCLILHILYRDQEPTLESVRNLLMSTSNFDELFRKIGEYEHDPSKSQGWTGDDGASTPIHPEVGRLARIFEATPNRERGSIISTLARFLDLWGDPRIVAATSESAWNLDVFSDDQRSTVYVTIPTNQLGRLAPLLRILVATLMVRVTEVEGTFEDREAQGGPPLYLVLDEFASLGRIPLLEDMLAFLRGYGVRCLVAVQDFSQLRRLYGPHHSISATCRLHVASSSSDVSTRQEVSRRLGESTHVYRKRSRSGRMWNSKSTISQAEVRRPLLTEGEIGTLPADQLLVVKAGHPPVLARKLPYWSHPDLKNRAQLALELEASPPQREADL